LRNGYSVPTITTTPVGGEGGANRTTSFLESDAEGAAGATRAQTGTGGMGSGSLTLKPPTITDKRKKFAMRAYSGGEHNQL
jgi:hypothetical protein